MSAVRMLKPVESLGSARKPKQRDRGGRVGQHEDPGQGWESRVASFCLLLSRLTPRDVPCARRDDAVALAADRDAGPAVEVVPGRGEARKGTAGKRVRSRRTLRIGPRGWSGCGRVSGQLPGRGGCGRDDVLTGSTTWLPPSFSVTLARGPARPYVEYRFLPKPPLIKPAMQFHESFESRSSSPVIRRWRSIGRSVFDRRSARRPESRMT